MIELTLLIPIAVLGFLLWWEKRDRAIERKAWELERIALVQRIQAPHVEVQKYQAEHEASDAPISVGLEDEDWEQYVDARDAGEAV